MVPPRFGLCHAMQIVLLIITFNISTTQAVDQSPFQTTFCFNDKGNYTANRTYQTNLYALLPSLLPSNNNRGGYWFYNASRGEDPDKVYAIRLCRGDVKLDTCATCLRNATNHLTHACPNQKEAIGWYGICMFRYSNRFIFGKMENSPDFYTRNTQNLSSLSVDEFTLGTLMERLTSEAAAAGSVRKFAVGNATAANSNPSTIFGLAQCTPDLSEADCKRCLKSALANIPECCFGKQGGRVVTPSCNLRYDIYLFFDPSIMAPLSLPPVVNTTIPGGKKSNTSRVVIIIVVAIFVSLLLIISISDFTCSGYMAPEYVMRRQFSVKSDVYSFGVIVLEIASGQKRSSSCNEDNSEDLLVESMWSNVPYRKTRV